MYTTIIAKEKKKPFFSKEARGTHEIGWGEIM